MKRENIDKIAQTQEDKILLAKLWDKISSGIHKNIPVNTCFLSIREQEIARFLFGDTEGLYSFGGYDDAERKMLVYLPDYLEEEALPDTAALACLRATFYQGDSPTHRDFLGALTGAGIAREVIGDILVNNGSCDFFVTQEVAPFVLQNFVGAGRTKVKLQQIPLSDVAVPKPETKEIRDTLPSLRLDSVISAGFRVSRSAAAEFVIAGRTAINGLPCEKPDKVIDEGATVSVRGLGKIQLKLVNGQTKKGRISVVIDRYV
ncbi:MAG: RNA-binding protein [Oscillospiraceae bacterium]|nr:RNA-binding protein [Oscillospiraceae bacterium]